MSPAKKKGGKQPPHHIQRKPQEILVVSEQPVKITTVTTPPTEHKSDVWSALAAIRQALWYGFWIGVGLTPIGAHIISQFYCGGEKPRCSPIEFPAWMEAGGIIVALIFANASKDVVSKSARQLAEAAKGWLPWAKKDADAQPPPDGGV